MAKKFAFGLSMVDMVRKTMYRYEQPIDYLAALTEHAYRPGASVQIEVLPEKLTVSSGSTIDDKFFKDVEKGDVGTLASVMPPSRDFGHVEVRSGNKALDIDAERNITASKANTLVDGTEIVIRRFSSGAARQQLQKEVARLFAMYTGSDMSIMINGTEAASRGGYTFRFDGSEFHGMTAYNPNSQGGLHFYHKGRYVSSEPLAPAVDISLHAHPFQPTVTRSRIITQGQSSADYQRLQQFLPSMFVAILKSEHIRGLRQSSEASYRTLTAILSKKYPDNEELRGFVLETLRTGNNAQPSRNGSQGSDQGTSPEAGFSAQLSPYAAAGLGKVGKMLGVWTAVSPGTDFVYDQRANQLGIPVSFLAGDPVVTAITAVPFMAKDPTEQFRLQKKLTENYRKG